MAHEVLPLPFKPHRLEGLSDRLLVSHYENNYGGAVRRLNAIEGRLADLDFGAAPVFDLNGLGRERLIAANSMLLHEAYFDALGGSGEPGGGLAGALERDFGSVDRWRTEFTAMGKALAGGSGWVLLTWSERLGRLTNQWAADHCHTLADGVAGAGARHVRARLRPRFRRQGGRLRGRLHAQHPLGAHRGTPRSGAGSRRPAAALAEPGRTQGHRRRASRHAGARRGRHPGRRLPRRGPAQARRHAARGPLPSARAHRRLGGRPAPRPPVVAYCIYGFQVSGEATAELRRRGLDAHARSSGGIAAWHAMGGPTVPLTPEIRTRRHLDDQVDHARAAEDRPHRLPLADPALRRAGRRIPLRADRAGVRGRQGDRGHPLRHPRCRAVRPRRRPLHVRRPHQAFQAGRPGAAQARADRARRRHRPP